MANLVTLEDQDHYVYAVYSGADYMQLLTRELTDVVPTSVTTESTTLDFDIGSVNSSDKVFDDKDSGVAINATYLALFTVLFQLFAR